MMGELERRKEIMLPPSYFLLTSNPFSHCRESYIPKALLDPDPPPDHF
jgi:hypothetical protein